MSQLSNVSAVDSALPTSQHNVCSHVAYYIGSCITRRGELFFWTCEKCKTTGVRKYEKDLER